MHVKMLGIVGTPGCGCGADAWVVIDAKPQLLCFRHDAPTALAIVVDKPWISSQDLARQMVAKFRRCPVEDLDADDPLVPGAAATVQDHARVLAGIPVGAVVAVNGQFLLYRHLNGAGSRPLGRLVSSPHHASNRP